jgi:hypothetical protein
LLVIRPEIEHSLSTIGRGVVAPLLITYEK